MKKYILVSPTEGVYLGSFLGLGFWSKLDSADQEEAIAFNTHEEAIEYSKSWDQQLEGLYTTEVESDNNYIHKDKISKFW